MAKAFTFFREYRDLCEELNDEERLRVYECVMDYSLDGEDCSEYLGELKPVFDQIIDIQKEKNRKKKEDRKEVKRTRKKKWKGPKESRKDKYKRYLKSGHWKALRKEILAEYKECEVCHAKGRLELHHKWYGGESSILRKETKADLAVLCQHCHKQYHETYPSATKANYSEFYKKNYQPVVRGIVKKDGSVVKFSGVYLSVNQRVDK